MTVGGRSSSRAILTLLVVVAACAPQPAPVGSSDVAVAPSFGGSAGPSGSPDPRGPGSTSGPSPTGMASDAVPTSSSAGATVPPTAGAQGPISTPTQAPGATAIPTAAATPPPTRGPTSPPPTPPPSAPPATPPPATAPPATPGPIPPLSACSIFPSSNVWNQRVDGLPVASSSAAMIQAIGIDASLHPDFSAAGGYGIPYNLVGAATPRSTVTFEYDDESDPVGYPIPARPKIEGGSDRHILMIDTDSCTLFELYAAQLSGGTWTAGSGATWDLDSNALRPDGWTSADAAGLPIFPGLVRYPEVAAGVIRHAIRFTAPSTCGGYLYPARHEAGSGSCSTKPPMGLRVRLKASVDVDAFGPQARVVLVALQRYGMLLADNGSPWYITGAPDNRWNDDELHDLGQLRGADFEVVDTSTLRNG